MKILKKQIWLLVLLSLVLWSCGNDSDGPISGELPAINILNDSYGPEPIQSLNVYLPAGRTSETPLLIYMHGGAWIQGDKSEFDSFRPLAETYFPDYAYISIGYRLHGVGTTVNTFPTQENDIIAALDYIMSQTSAWNVSDEIILAGASAGGHLTLLHGYKHKDIGNIKGLIALFPPTELESLSEFNLITQLGLNSIMGGSPQAVPMIYTQSSPVNFVDSGSLPTIFFHGTEDTVVPISQSELLAATLEASGVPYEYVIYPGQGHGFDAVTYSRAFEQAAAFTSNFMP